MNRKVEERTTRAVVDRLCSINGEHIEKGSCRHGSPNTVVMGGLLTRRRTYCGAVPAILRRS